MEQMDRQLVSRIAGGDGDAFVEFYDRHAPRILGMLVDMLKHHGDAEDVLQEVFWQVWCKAKKYGVCSKVSAVQAGVRGPKPLNSALFGGLFCSPSCHSLRSGVHLGKYQGF